MPRSGVRRYVGVLVWGQVCGCPGLGSGVCGCPGLGSGVWVSWSGVRCVGVLVWGQEVCDVLVWGQEVCSVLVSWSGVRRYVGVLVWGQEVCWCPGLESGGMFSVGVLV